MFTKEDMESISIVRKLCMDEIILKDDYEALNVWYEMEEFISEWGYYE